jgi:adenylate cyclase
VAELFVVNGICGGTVFFLPDVPTVLGRSPECHVQVADPWVSSMHALFERRGDQLWVVDLDSRNGTFVGDERIQEAPVAPGARLRFGKTGAELRVQPRVVDPPSLLSDQRTVIRYIADLAAESATPRVTPERPSPPEARRETIRDTGRATLAGNSPTATRRQVAIMNEISRALLGATGLTDALQRLLRVLSGVLAADCSSVLLMDERGEMVPLVAEPPDRPPQLSATVVQAALRSFAGILTLDAQQDLRFSESKSVIMGGIRSCICAPIWADNRILGVLLLQRGAADPFTADDLELATMVGFQAALTVEHERMSERARSCQEARQRLAQHLPVDTVSAVSGSDAPEKDSLEPALRHDVAVVSVVLSGLPALAAARPAPESALRVLALQHALAQLLLDLGAMVEQRLDGGLLAVFGFPQSRPDPAPAALRAARAALERADALESGETPRLELRLGVDAGHAVVGNFGPVERPDLRAVGESVEAALRLALDASPGEVLVGAGAARLSRRAGDETLEIRRDGRTALRVAPIGTPTPPAPLRQSR